jgi:hypothetical protein
LTFAGHQQAHPHQRVCGRARISSAAQCLPFCIWLTQHDHAFAVCVLLQATSKLILINAFVDAHISAVLRSAVSKIFLLPQHDHAFAVC